jgi:hypothetical protein
MSDPSVSVWVAVVTGGASGDERIAEHATS